MKIGSHFPSMVLDPFLYFWEETCPYELFGNLALSLNENNKKISSEIKIKRHLYK